MKSMSKLKKIFKWSNKKITPYLIIVIFFVIWMIFFDTNSFLIHNELNDDIRALEENKEFFQNEINQDKHFIEKMKDSDEIEKFAREKYYLKRDNEDIYIIERNDSVKIKNKR